MRSFPLSQNFEGDLGALVTSVAPVTNSHAYLDHIAKKYVENRVFLKTAVKSQKRGESQRISPHISE